MQYRKIEVKNKITKIESSTKDSLLDELLALKNITSKSQVERFLNPKKEYFISPYAFLDMERAVQRIQKAIKDKEKILIWGDFDCDGVTSTSILYKTLTELSADVEVFIPDRLLNGHGLNSKELLKLISKQKVKLVITVDCGISNNNEVKLLKNFGVDTIITDHHSTDSEIPCAYAVINPQVSGSIKEDLSIDEIESLTYYSGSIVAYKLAMALLDKISNDNLKDELLVIASVGAIADVVPILGENRAMVAFALKVLNEKKQNSHMGIYKLLYKNINDKQITSYDIAFVVAPRINAVGRLANAKLSFDFLTTSNVSALDIIIEKLENYNTIRQSKCLETYNEISEYLKNNKSELNNPAVILLNPDWHVGIIGIVASKIAEEYNKPCFLMTTDENNNARCSIRSNNLVNVYEVLKQNESLFSGFGGHSGAGGCSFGKDEFENVKKALLETTKELMVDNNNNDILYADIELEPQDVELSILDTINQMEPFGEKNEPPVFAMFNVNLEEFKLIGKEKNHLRLVFSKNDKKFQCIKWSENEINIPLNSNCDIAFYPRLNEFNDKKSIQLEILDIYSINAVNKNKNNGYKFFDHRKKTGILPQIASYLSTQGLDIAIWAKNPNTKANLAEYEQLKNNFIVEKSEHNGIMFFDYPSCTEEFIEILSDVKPKKIHLMNFEISENLESYIKQLIGMIKYCANKLDGTIDILKMAQTIGVNENFIQIALEILENIDSIRILDVEKIEYIKPFSFVDFKNNSMYELLKEEFNNIVEFKKHILNCDIKEIEKLVYENL